MVRFYLLHQLRYAWATPALRATVAATVAVTAVIALGGNADSPTKLLVMLTWTQLLLAIVVGGFLTGWRVAQFPKSRAIEFHLVTPVSDWEHVGGELAAGMLRTLVVIVGGLPFVAAVLGAGWINAGEAASLVAVPLVGGWLSGLILATVAYEPPWVRRLLERAVLAGVMVYLLLVGLLGHWFVPWLIRWWAWHASRPTSVIRRLGTTLSDVNPFHLLGDISHTPGSVAPGRMVAVLGLLLTAAGLCYLRLVVRLRTHYEEEQFGLRGRQAGRGKPLGTRPLCWWTARRVSRFKGNVNLYLAWATIGLYGGWMLAGDRWPAWIAFGQLRMIQRLGGAALLAAAALQMAVVGVAFLGGLWDSDSTRRVRRLELLLVAPLEPWAFFEASAVAAWTRGRGYVLGALAMALAATLAGKISWPTCSLLVGLGATYLWLSLSVAFRNFARLRNDRVVGLWGLAWSVGWPVATIGLFQLGLGRVAAFTPLGAVYLVMLPPAEQLALTGFSTNMLLGCVTAASAGWVTFSVLLIHRALVTFDVEIHGWFAAQLETRPAGMPARKPLPAAETLMPSTVPAPRPSCH